MMENIRFFNSEDQELPEAVAKAYFALRYPGGLSDVLQRFQDNLQLQFHGIIILLNDDNSIRFAGRLVRQGNVAYKIRFTLEPEALLFYNVEAVSSQKLRMGGDINRTLIEIAERLHLKSGVLMT